MFPIVVQNVRVVSRNIAANALQLAAKYRMDFIEISLKREAREAWSVLRRIIGLEDVAFGHMEAFIVDLGVRKPEAAALEIDRQLGGAPRVLDLEQLLGELEFQTAHQPICAMTRTAELQALADRYGATRLDRANAEGLCDELDELRKSFRIYRERGWILVGAKYRRIDVSVAIDHLSGLLPGLSW